MYHTTWQRLSSAVECLASGKGRIKERLPVALGELLPLLENEFPSELQAPFAALFARMDSVKDNTTQGTLHVFVEGLSDEEASKIAKEVFSWFDTVAREHCS